MSELFNKVKEDDQSGHMAFQWQTRVFTAEFSHVVDTYLDYQGKVVEGKHLCLVFYLLTMIFWIELKPLA